MSNQKKIAHRKARDTYNAAADYFDDPANQYWQRYGRRTVERISLQSGARVLDVGCGTGTSAIPAAEIIGTSGKVIGVDLAENLLKIARQKANALELENCEFKVADMETTGYPDKSFDAIVSIFSIFFVQNMEDLAAELWRMLRPNGVLAITTWGPRIFEPMYGKYQSDLKKLRPDLYSAFSPWERITTLDSVEQMMNAAGISNAKAIPESGTIQLARPEDWWKVALGSGLRWTIDNLKDEEAQHLRESNIRWAKENGIDSIETNVIYATARKDG